MGCDGGTIPKRHELVKGPKKVEKVDKDAELVAQWNYCTLSQEILRRPIVACELGRLYNKDAVIEFLLDKSSEKALGKAASHIKSIKNVTELRLSDNPAWEGDKGSTKGDKHDDLQRARFICPVVGLEMNGRHRFCYLRCCGCVFSERALKEIKAEVCHTPGRKQWKKSLRKGWASCPQAPFYSHRSTKMPNETSRAGEAVVMNGQRTPRGSAQISAARAWGRQSLQRGRPCSPRPPCGDAPRTSTCSSEAALARPDAPFLFPCGAAFQEDDVIVLNGTKEDVEMLQTRMEERRLRAKLGKKTKKPKAAESVSKSDVSEEAPGPSKMKAGKPEETSLDSREKKTSSAPRSAAAHGSSSGKVGKPLCGAPKRSIADSGESEAYKSLFTTHSSAKRSKEESAHWVTHTSYCF
ncbi:replication termination factor 2 isoform X3 [Phacochoerus africanus]|uniref:replication termination factor 2 isoform X3 n=1 Tax=Phacochoerus africanus TaxID=41426 RepID=UPI001FD8DB57|nr:replication termination factor 2 isoform X3 [Phacochoerus africanus]